MNGEITIEQPLTLRGFCETVFRKHFRNWPPDENVVAHEFVSSFQLETFVTLEKLLELCETLGMTICVQDVPKGIRGFNHVYQEKRHIIIGNTGPRAAALGSREHTLLHEIREQIEYEFRKIAHPVAHAEDKEQRAENFASCVRLFASGKALLPIFQDVFSEATSGWAQFGITVLFALLFVVCSLSCIALPLWEDRL